MISSQISQLLLLSLLGKISLPVRNYNTISSSMGRKDLTLRLMGRCIWILLLATIPPTPSHLIRCRDIKNTLTEILDSKPNGFEGEADEAERNSKAGERSEALAPEPEPEPEPWDGRQQSRINPGIASGPRSMLSSDVQLDIQDDHVVMDNGVVQVTLTNPGGMVSGIQYNGIDILEVNNEEDGRGYWDLNWCEPDQVHSLIYDRMEGTNFSVIIQDSNQVELSFTRTWDPSFKGNHTPLNIDKRFIMLRDSPGFYSYGIYQHLEGWPDFDLAKTRIVFRPSQDKFDYMAVSDIRQRLMPTAQDRATGQRLAYPEAILLTNPTNLEFKGEVDDKYQYSCEDQNNGVHGWISRDPFVGFWMITPSNEFRTGGPLKQHLTSHVGPTTLAVFVSDHYGGTDMFLRFRNKEPWKKVFGPVFIYLNSVSDGQDSYTLDPYATLWEDAKQQLTIEVQSWPYNFPISEDYPYYDQRGTVSGRLLVLDRYIDEEFISVDSAYVGLALPGDIGSWQTEGKGYQFWTKTDVDGLFSIYNVRKGDYNLYAWVPGFIGEYKYDLNLTITQGCDIDMGVLIYEPPRNGPTLWEIGIPDRSAAEFYIPDPNPMYINKLYLDHNDSYGRPVPVDKFRQYGLWERYKDLYPNEDLIYTVGISDYKKDWFFAQVTRKQENNTFLATTWQVIFELDNVDNGGTYKLRLALASANNADLLVRFNDPVVYPPHLQTGQIGKDNAIARHGIHGLYHLYSVDVPSYLLIVGNNTIFLTQNKSVSPFQGIMYDYIRLEGPPNE